MATTPHWLSCWATLWTSTVKRQAKRTSIISKRSNSASALTAYQPLRKAPVFFIISWISWIFRLRISIRDSVPTDSTSPRLDCHSRESSRRQLIIVLRLTVLTSFPNQSRGVQTHSDLWVETKGYSSGFSGFCNILRVSYTNAWYQWQPPSRSRSWSGPQETRGSAPKRPSSAVRRSWASDRSLGIIPRTYKVDWWQNKRCLSTPETRCTPLQACRTPLHPNSIKIW